MELYNKRSSQLVSPSGTKFRESSFFEQFADYLSQLPSTLFAKLHSKFGHDITEHNADTNQRGHIIDLKAENASSFPGSSFVDENETSDKLENADEADLCEETILLILRNGSLSMPFEVVAKILTFPLTLFRKPAKVIYKPSQTYENIKANLQHFEDNGNFKEFDIYSNNMVKKYREKKDFDIVTNVKVEQAKCAIYRNDLNAAKRLAREAHELAESTRFPPLFHALAFLVLSSVSRYKQKLGKAKKYLDLAKQSFESGYSIEDFALFYELYGNYLDQFLGISSGPDKQVIKDLALTSFQKMSEIGSQDSRQRVSDKKRFYALIKSARILLDSNSSFGRKRTVTENSIHIAAERLGVIKRDFQDSIPRGSKIQFQLVESDLYYRQGKFEDAIELLKKSFDEAKELGYKAKGPIICITERIQEIEHLVSEKMNVVEKTSHGREASSNTSCYDSETSQSAESDIFSSEYL